MQFTNSLRALLLLAASSVVVNAAPLDIYSPPILIPNAATVWVVGQTTDVVWDASNPPQNISNRASVVLHRASDTTRLTLAQDFDLRAGSVSVVVPNVATGNDYAITLFGDSGNISPDFQIIAN